MTLHEKQQINLPPLLSLSLLKPLQHAPLPDYLNEMTNINKYLFKLLIKLILETNTWDLPQLEYLKAAS
jgi:hypothetical protein